MWPFKKKQTPKHQFDDLDREKAAMKNRLRKLELRILAAKARKLEKEANGVYDEPHGSKAGTLLRELRDLDKLREHLTPQQDLPAAEGDDPILKALLPYMLAQGMSKAPETQEEVVQQLDRSNKKAARLDQIDVIISQMPEDLKKQIRSGKVPKPLAKAATKKAVDSSFEKVWQRLRTGQKK